MLRIGHRGAAGYEPENTLCSIERAITHCVDFVEFDVQRTRDGYLVLLHDKRVDRTGNLIYSPSTLPCATHRHGSHK